MCMRKHLLKSYDRYHDILSDRCPQQYLLLVRIRYPMLRRYPSGPVGKVQWVQNGFWTCIKEKLRSQYLYGFFEWDTSHHLSKPTAIIPHDDVIKWKIFPCYWSFVRGIHRLPVNFPHKGQLRGALMFSLICAWINRWVNNREAGDLRRHRAHHDVTVMINDKVSTKAINVFQWCTQGLQLRSVVPEAVIKGRDK